MRWYLRISRLILDGGKKRKNNSVRILQPDDSVTPGVIGRLLYNFQAAVQAHLVEIQHVFHFNEQAAPGGFLRLFARNWRKNLNHSCPRNEDCTAVSGTKVPVMIDCQSQSIPVEGNRVGIIFLL